jgi:16S rRNA G966 N2-methylase RsmD
MRVIAGQFKASPLQSPKGKSVRPTSDRVKESLFNILQNKIEGAHILDLYAGAGSIGIEALSRGAAQVTFVERDSGALEYLKENLKIYYPFPKGSLSPTEGRGLNQGVGNSSTSLIISSLEKEALSSMTLYEGTVETYLKTYKISSLPSESLPRRGGKARLFDIVFADPPYADLRPDLLDKVFKSGCLQSRGLLIVEHVKTFQWGDLGLWELKRQERYGRTVLSFFLSYPLNPAIVV